MAISPGNVKSKQRLLTSFKYRVGSLFCSTDLTSTGRVRSTIKLFCTFQ